jgi:competence protein ComGA
MILITKTIYLFSKIFQQKFELHEMLQMKLWPICELHNKKYFFAQQYNEVYAQNVDGVLVVLGNDFSLIKEYIVTDFILHAILLEATDIHMVHDRIFYKKNRNLLGIQNLEKEIFTELKNFLKIFCNLSLLNQIDESGAFYVNFIGDIIGVRVSCFEGVSNLLNNHNTLISFRLLYPIKNINIQKNTPKMCWLLDNLTKGGLFVICGKTGMGKTTLMYDLLSLLTQKNCYTIITAEDPIEHIIPNILQREIQNNYEDIIKSILRHNPDLIVVGEIRDKNTAAMCVRAALTGHSVLCTIHLNTNNIKQNFFYRFQEFGIEEQYLKSSIKCFIEMLPNYHFNIIKLDN